MKIRNVAIIAHVDHGKTTLVDGFLKQTHVFRENEAAFTQSLIMDSSDQERERGITIMAKNTAVVFNDVKINIIDTPGHADFGGEVERTLNMADGAILVVDAKEGPMPQTKFVLGKALEMGMKIIVVINKIDKKDARVDYVINKLHDLFLDMATDPEQLEFPVFYAIAREGKAWAEMPGGIKDSAGGEHGRTTSFDDPADLTPIFEDIVRHIHAPEDRNDEPFQMLVSTLDRDNFQGKYAIGRITRGKVKPGMAVVLLHDEKTENAKVEKVFVSQGLKRIEVPEATCGEIVALTGVANAGIGSTIADAENPEALPTIIIEEPTLKMSVGANTSPFAGKEGKFVTSRNILDRINKELETNVSLKMEPGTEGDYILSGRGELHLSVFIETLRREGFELQVGKPHVITKEIDGIKSEPVEELTIDVAADAVGPVTSEVGRRKGKLLSQEDNGDGSTRLTFEITTRGMIGLRNQLLTISKGTAVMSSIFLQYSPMTGEIITTRNGVLVASDPGKALGYGLNIAQGRGVVFIHPQAQVYRGMIVGLNSRENDIDINVTKSKNLTNVRASGSDDALNLTPPTIFSLEQALDFLEDDELLEVTPASLRLRKKYLDPNERKRHK